MKYSDNDVRDIQHEKAKVIKAMGESQGQGSVSGKFWYSKRQRKELDSLGRDRMFVRLFSGRTIEYTQMVNYEALMDDPFDSCFYEDAVYLGEGTFSHFEGQ